jgi:hypothetical protein
MCDIQQIWFQIERTSSSLQYVKCGPGHIQCIYSSAYSVFNFHLNVSAPLLQISRACHARYTANLEPNAAHVLQFTQCVLWSLTYTKYLQLLIVRSQYTTEPDCAATRDMPPFGCALYCNIGAKYSAHPPVYASWTVVQVIYNVIAARHIQASIFKWTYRGCYWRYLDNSMCVTLQTWCQI